MELIDKESTPARQLMQLPGVGPTNATAIVAMIGSGHEFKCCRQLSAWLGLVPGQYSSGGKQRLGRITKARDPYLRMLLMHLSLDRWGSPCSWRLAATGGQESRSGERRRASVSTDLLGSTGPLRQCVGELVAVLAFGDDDLEVALQTCKRASS